MLLALWVAALPALAATDAVSVSTFEQQIAGAQSLVTACAAVPSACKGASVPAEEHVAGQGGHPAFAVSWEWLGSALDGARTASTTDRAMAMREASDHLTELAAEASGTAGAALNPGFERARSVAATILAGSEFRSAEEGPSWWERLIARVQDWIFALLAGMGRVGGRHPWLAPLIAWSCFVLAAGGLLFFVLRSLQRQALHISLGENAGRAQGTDRDTVDWATLAEERAATRDWREGIHCLYWAAIASLEGRRAWRHNPARTPREYLQLLRPGSEVQRALRELTRGFEQAWYGHGESSETNFRAAQVSYRVIAAADLRRGEDPAASPALSSRVGIA